MIDIILSYVVAFFALFTSVFFLLLYLEHGGQIKEEPAPCTDKECPTLTIIIPAFNEEGVLSQTVRSVLEADYPKNKLQVIVVDDGSNDGTLAEAKKFEKSGALVITQKNAGKAAAINNGIRKAKGELIATLDSDSYLEKGALKQMVAHFKDDQVMAAISHRRVHEPKNFLEKLQSIEYLFFAVSNKLMAFLDSVNVTPGPLSIFRANVFKSLGGFDEKNIMEDQEMGMRIQKANGKIVASTNAIVYTSVPRTFKALMNQRVRWNRGGLRNMIKHRALFDPKYGNLGSIVMPLGLLSIVIIFCLLVASAFTLISGKFLDYLFYGSIASQYGTTPVFIVGVLMFAFSLIWLWIGLRVLGKQKTHPVLIGAYLFIYTFFSSIFWLVTVYREAMGKKLKW